MKVRRKLHFNQNFNKMNNSTFFLKIDENAQIPEQNRQGDLGFDIKCTSIEYDDKRDRYIFHTGLKMEMPQGVHAFIVPRSANTKTEAYLANSVGVIDSNYRGELLIIYKNRTSYEVNCMLVQWKYMNEISKAVPINQSASNVSDAIGDMKTYFHEKPMHLPEPMDLCPYNVGDRIAQLIFFTETPMEAIETTEELSDTVRGDKGFGSSGR